MRKISFIFVSTFIILLLSACGDKIESNMSTELPEFEFTDQDGDPFSNSDLEGEWWIADMIFTNCTSVCIPMTDNMVQLQQDAQEKDLDVNFLSFTVDPDYDSPEVLSEYAESYDADLTNWAFLTGYDFETIQEISVDSFYANVELEPDSDQVAHGVRFYLINPEGEVIKHYNGLENEDIEQIMEDLENVL